MIKLRKILLCKFIYILLFFVSLTYLIIALNINYTSKYERSDSVIVGKIADLEYKGNKLSATIKGDEKIIANYYFDTKEHLTTTKKNLSLGDTIKLKGELVEPFSSQNFYSFSYQAYLKNQKIFYLMKVTDFTILEKNSNIFLKLKNFVRSKINNDIVGSYINIFFLGNNTNFDIDLIDKFQKLGISHLFALSGTQVTLLILIIEKILNFFKIKHLKKVFIIFMIVGLYYTIITPCAAIDRAIIFSFIFYLNKAFNFNIKPFHLILLSLSILFFINPFYIYDIGFQYSAVITCTLILFMDNKLSKGKIVELLKVSWVSFLVSLPISLYHFSYINILSIIYNLFYVPFINFIIFPLSIICFFIPVLSTILEYFITIFEQSVNYLSSIKLGYFVLARIPIYFYFIYFLLIFSYLYLKRKIIMVILTLFLLMHYLYPKISCSDRLYMIDVGQGDSFLLISKNKTMLIDTGGVMEYYNEPWKKYEKQNRASYIISFLRCLGITKLDYLVLTHGDYDHAGEALNLMKTISVGVVLFNNNKLNDLEKQIWHNSLNKYKLKEQDQIILGNFHIQVLSNTYTDENDSSLVLLATISNKKILFMGDASIKSENYILDNYNISNITILKVGHHGSKTSSSESFIKTTNPTYALISAGIDNKFNHPNKEVVKRLKDNQTIIYDVRKNGMVMFDFTNNLIKTKK